MKPRGQPAVDLPTRQGTESDGRGAPSLRQLQAAFAEALFSREPPASVACLGIAASHARERFAIYRHSLIERSTTTLRGAYPVLHRLVGPGFFGNMARNYVYAYPSSSYDLDELGRHLGGFVADLPEAAGRPYLADVARLEWAVHETLRAPDAAPLGLDALASVPPERYDGVKLVPHPTARLVASPFPVLRIWEVNQADREAVETVDLDSGPSSVLVDRRDNRVRLRTLGRGEFLWIVALCAGETLGAATARAFEDETDFDLSACLAAHLLDGTFSGVAFPPTRDSSREMRTLPDRARRRLARAAQAP